MTDPADMPAVETEVVLWGDDPELGRWLAEHSIRTRPFASTAPAHREVILASRKPPAPGGAAAFAELRAAHRRRLHGRLPLAGGLCQGRPADRLAAAGPQGHVAPIWGWLYLKDEWASGIRFSTGCPAAG